MGIINRNLKLYKNILSAVSILCVGVFIAGIVFFSNSVDTIDVANADYASMGVDCPNVGAPSQDSDGQCGYCGNDRPEEPVTTCTTCGPSVPLLCPDGVTPVPYTTQTVAGGCEGGDNNYRCWPESTSIYYGTCPVPPTICTPTTQTTTNSCNPGETGTGRTYTRESNTCTPGVWSSWSEIDNRCTPTPTCSPLDETAVNACPAGYNGTQTMQRHSSTCTPGVWTQWQETANTCDPVGPTCDPVTASHTYACNAGETGTGRTYQALGNTCQVGVWSNWSLISDDCTTSCPSFATTTTYACNPGETGAGRTYQSTTRAVDLSCSLEWNPWTLVTNDCTTSTTCVASTTRQSYVCNAGETGTGRTYKATASVCEVTSGVWGAWSPWSPWTLESTDCVGGTATTTPTVVPVVNLGARIIGSSNPFTSGPLSISGTDQIELRWLSSNTTRCIGTNFSTNTGVPGNPTPISGTQTNVVEPADGSSETYTVSCSYNTGPVVTDSVTVSKNNTALGGMPTLLAVPQRVRIGETVTLSGTRGGQTNCTLSGPNVGGAGLNSMAISTNAFTQTGVVVQGDTTFTLSCLTPGATVHSTVTVFPIVEEI